MKPNRNAEKATTGYSKSLETLEKLMSSPDDSTALEAARTFLAYRGVPLSDPPKARTEAESWVSEGSTRLEKADWVLEGQTFGVIRTSLKPGAVARVSHNQNSTSESFSVGSVHVNGLAKNVGLNGDCYFCWGAQSQSRKTQSRNTQGRGVADVVPGDLLYWNENLAGYSIMQHDVITCTSSDGTPIILDRPGLSVVPMKRVVTQVDVMASSTAASINGNDLTAILMSPDDYDAYNKTSVKVRVSLRGLDKQREAK